MIAVVASPEYPERQLQAAQALAQRAYEFRTSFAGQDFAKRSAAARKGKR